MAFLSPVHYPRVHSRLIPSSLFPTYGANSVCLPRGAPGRVHRCLCTGRGGSTHRSRANPCRGLLSRNRRSFLVPACREAIEPARGLGQPLAEGLAERLELL